MLGQIREVYKVVTRSSGWNKIRLLRLSLDGKKCRACGSKNLLQVHHIEPFSDHPELELDINNTITLCDKCHLFLGHLRNWKSYNISVVNDSLYWYNKITGRPA